MTVHYHKRALAEKHYCLIFTRVLTRRTNLKYLNFEVFCLFISRITTKNTDTERAEVQQTVDRHQCCSICLKIAVVFFSVTVHFFFFPSKFFPLSPVNFCQQRGRQTPLQNNWQAGFYYSFDILLQTSCWELVLAFKPVVRCVFFFFFLFFERKWWIFKLCH